MEVQRLLWSLRSMVRLFHLLILFHNIVRISQSLKAMSKKKSATHV